MHNSLEDHGWLFYVLYTRVTKNIGADKAELHSNAGTCSYLVPGRGLICQTHIIVTLDVFDIKHSPSYIQRSF